jgi:uncharacterized protein
MTRQDIISFLRDHKNKYGARYGLISLGIFGSVARGQMRDDSDIDICVKTQNPDPFMIVHIKEDLERSLKRHVDIVRIREQMNPFLKKRIDEEGIYV